MTAKEMWEKSGLSGDYEAWQFGDDPDKLAELVKEGIKTATSSLGYWYDVDPDEEEPQMGEISIILDSNDEAVCIIRTTAVNKMPFCEVTEEHAYKEGEGDRSLKYWREVHRDFFTRELAEEGKIFDENMLVICEEFQVVYS